MVPLSDGSVMLGFLAPDGQLQLRRLHVLGGVNRLVEPAEPLEVRFPAMHHADADPADVDVEMPEEIKEVDFEIVVGRFDPRAPAGNLRICEMIVNERDEILGHLVVRVAERDVFATSRPRTGIARFADVVDWLVNDLDAELPGDVARLVRAVVVDGDDLGGATPVAFVGRDGLPERGDGAPDVFLLVPGRDNNRERRVAHWPVGFSASSMSMTGIPSRTG